MEDRIVGKIYETDDYQKFTIMKGNRKVNDAHITSLVHEYTLKRKFLQPILVNSDFEIVDGQHRFYASKQLKVPVKYIIDEESDIEDVQSLNRVAKNWRSLDLLESKIKHNHPEYIMIKKFMDLYQMHLGTVLQLFAGRTSIPSKKRALFGGSGSLVKAFNFGKPYITLTEKEAHEVAEKIYNFAPYLVDKKTGKSMYLNQTIQKTITHILYREEYIRETYSHDRMLQQLEDNKGDIKPPKPIVDLVKWWFEMTYNIGKKGNMRVELITTKERNKIIGYLQRNSDAN